MSWEELIRKGLAGPHRVPPFLFNKLLSKLGIKQWGRRAPVIKMAEYRHRRSTYAHEVTPIWSRDWDLLIVLDACRPEWIRTVKGEYIFINNVETIHSVGSHSNEWVSNTFTDKYAESMEDTIYITGNHYANGLDESPLKAFETAHDYGDWAYNSASPPANVITDLAVQTARREEWDQCIVHYMQPHKPFLSRGDERDEYSVAEWSFGHDLYHNYFQGELTVNDLHEAFTDNLRYVLEEVELLLGNVDAPKAVLTADHGQAFGEGGLWDHVPGVNHPCVREVPWVETSAEDTQSLQPDEYAATEYDEETVEENLKKLGYL